MIFPIDYVSMFLFIYFIAFSSSTSHFDNRMAISFKSCIQNMMYSNDGQDDAKIIDSVISECYCHLVIKLLIFPLSLVGQKCSSK